MNSKKQPKNNVDMSTVPNGKSTDNDIHTSTHTNTHSISKKNWYVKMHSSDNKTNRPHVSQSIRRLNLSIFFRIWFAVVVIIVIASVKVFTELYGHVRPTTKQVIEDTLVDTGKLLSVYFSEPLATGELKKDAYQHQLDKAFSPNTATDITINQDPRNQRRFVNEERLHELSTWFHQKNSSSFRIYITDNTGMVVYDSRKINNAEGQDYGQWNDVYLTLKGHYGARSSRDIAEVESSSLMYVAQPIRNTKGDIIGVVSVGKPVATILPYLNVARQKMLSTSIFIMLLSIFLAGLIAWWLKQSIMLVITYTQSLASDTAKPRFYFGHELNVLTDNIEEMKHNIENKAYVTDYVHTLTHELKSPLTAIKASGELLGDANLDEEDRQTLSQTINEQSQKLELLIDKLLLLAKVEQPDFRLNTTPLNITTLIQTLLSNQHASIQKHNLSISYLYENQSTTADKLAESSSDKLVLADEFWLSQALDNIIRNAVHFADSAIEIHMYEQKQTMSSVNKKNITDTRNLVIEISNDGNPIPDFALEKVFDKYFSLSHNINHQNTHGKKGTGLGLTLAKQVIEHHHGVVNIDNIDNIDNNKNTAREKLQVIVEIYLPII